VVNANALVKNHIESDFIKIEHPENDSFCCYTETNYHRYINGLWFHASFMLNYRELYHNRQNRFVSVVVDISCFQGFIIYQFVKLGWKMIKTMNVGVRGIEIFEISFFLFSLTFIHSSSWNSLKKRSTRFWRLLKTIVVEMPFVNFLMPRWDHLSSSSSIFFGCLLLICFQLFVKIFDLFD
jgi:hypothetical protein